MKKRNIKGGGAVTLEVPSCSQVANKINTKRRADRLPSLQGCLLV